MSESKTILVVDDDQDIVELLRDFLENDHFQVKTACDTAQAWDIFKESSDCIVLDIMMLDKMDLSFAAGFGRRAMYQSCF